jgi:hypothetical protein
VISLLQLILCAIREMAALVAWFLITVFNLLIAALGDLLSALLAILPDMPPVPQPPQGGFLGAVNWVFPVGQVAAAFLLFLSFWLVFVGIRVLLRWIKAV